MGWEGEVVGVSGFRVGRGNWIGSSVRVFWMVLALVVRFVACRG